MSLQLLYVILVSRFRISRIPHRIVRDYATSVIIIILLFALVRNKLRWLAKYLVHFINKLIL